MKKSILKSISDLPTTITGLIGGIFLMLKVLGLIPENIANELPPLISEIIGGIMSIILIIRAAKP
jgi:uncharacterized membrane-anchored protein